MPNRRTIGAAVAAATLSITSGYAVASAFENEPEGGATAENAGNSAEVRQDGDTLAAEHRSDADAGPADAATAQTADDTADTSDVTTASRPTDTHGYAVSTFVHETDLEGREKGEAVSELARTNGGSQASANQADAAQQNADDDEDEAGGRPDHAGKPDDAGGDDEDD